MLYKNSIFPSFYNEVAKDGPLANRIRLFGFDTGTLHVGVEPVCALEG